MNEQTSFKEEINGLEISVDWMSFTFTKFVSYFQALRFLGLSSDMFRLMSKGANGYKQMLRCSTYGISILYDGSDDMGVHVNVSGNGVSFLLLAFKQTLAVDTPFGPGFDCWEENLFATFCLRLAEVGKFTRLDIAIDDFGAKYFKPQDVFDKYQSDCVVTRFRNCTRNDKYDMPKSCCGYTVYFGSRQSEIMLRIYDKKLEQNGKKEEQLADEWVRWELELKDDRANQFAREFSDADIFGESAMGVLSYYFRIIVRDNENKSRCSLDPVWESFVNGVDKLRLVLKKVIRTLADKEIWIENQVAPTLCTLLLSYGGDMSKIYDMIHSNWKRMSAADKELLRNAVPEIYEHFFGSNQEWGYDGM